MVRGGEKEKPTKGTSEQAEVAQGHRGKHI